MICILFEKNISASDQTASINFTLGASKYNFEGYPDLTVYEAISHIEEEARRKRYRPIVYICSPFSGNVEENIGNARRYCRFAVNKGCIPIAPHLFFPQFMKDYDRDERDLAIFMGLALLTKCVEIWVFGDAISKGMTREISKAEAREMPVRYFDKDCQEVHE